MTKLESFVKYSFTFFVGSALALGGICGLIAIFGFIFGAR
jgi:hypothetical protein